MARIDGLNKVLAELKKRQRMADEDSKASVAVGYGTSYALPVHENMEMRLKGQPRPSGLGNYWGPNGQPKYLEGPFRELASVLADIVRTAVINGSRLPQALLLAGLRLQRESQRLVPVEFGALRASAFTVLEKR